MTTSPHSFVWYELMTSDMSAAEAFYGAVVGWRPQPFGSGAMPYTILNAGEAPVAGVMTIPEDARVDGLRPCWVGYIHADDVDAAADSVRQAGGAIHCAPSDIPEVGRFAVAADPQGAMFMLFNPLGGERPAPPPMAPGHVGWRELHTSDWQTAFDFYAGQFGWTKDVALDMGPMGTYQLFAAGGPAIGGMMNNQGGSARPAWLFYFNVDAADAALARVTAGGGQLLNGPHQVPGGSWIVQCTDPQGAMFALVAPTR